MEKKDNKKYVEGWIQDSMERNSIDCLRLVHIKRRFGSIHLCKRCNCSAVDFFTRFEDEDVTAGGCYDK